MLKRLSRYLGLNLAAFGLVIATGSAALTVSATSSQASSGLFNFSAATPTVASFYGNAWMPNGYVYGSAYLDYQYSGLPYPYGVYPTVGQMDPRLAMAQAISMRGARPMISGLGEPIGLDKINNGFALRALGY